MAWTQDDIDALDTAIKGNTAQVTFPNGQSITYRTMGELMRARTLAQEEVAKDAARASGKSHLFSLARFND